MIVKSKDSPVVTTATLREEAHQKFGRHKDSIVGIDYCSFTWTTADIIAIKRVANARIKSKEFSSFAAYCNSELAVDEIALLDSDCLVRMTKFLTVASKSFFDDEGAVADYWEENFVVNQRPYGVFGYKHSWEMFFNGQQIGIAAAGAKNGGCYVSFTGKGCSLLDFPRLHDAIKDFPKIRITRVDPYLDDYEGVYNYDYMVDQYLTGKFITCGKPPKWHKNEGGTLDFDKKVGRGKMIPDAGQTFYVGNRESGKLFRSYEKGRQLGDPDSPWVRHELELHSKNREIPLWVLLRPQDVLSSCYPALSFVLDFEPDTIPTPVKTQKRTLNISYKRSVQSLKTIGGALINVMRNARGMSDKQIIEELIGAPHDVPVSLRKLAIYIPRVKQNECNQAVINRDPLHRSGKHSWYVATDRQAVFN